MFEKYVQLWFYFLTLNYGIEKVCTVIGDEIYFEMYREIPVLEVSWVQIGVFWQHVCLYVYMQRCGENNSIDFQQIRNKYKPTRPV